MKDMAQDAGYILKPMLRVAVSGLAWAIVALVTLEVAIRAFQLAERLSMPYEVGQDNVVRLPAGLDVVVRVPGYSGIRYITDAFGARVATPRDAVPLTGEGVLVVGDSQALGWGIAFEDSFGARLASAVYGSSATARLLAAPATDPERYAWALREYRAASGARPGALVLTLNMGNDLEELTIGRQALRLNRAPRLARWLQANSFLYTNLQLLMQRVRDESWINPGTNLVLGAFSRVERLGIATGLAAVMHRIVEEHSDVPRIVVLIIASDYEFDLHEFPKYRKYYVDQQSYDRALAALPQMAAAMREMREVIVASLRVRGIPVVDLAEIIPARRGLYDPGYHHISADGHREAALYLGELFAR
jgi:hypothetical protein